MTIAEIILAAVLLASLAAYLRLWRLHRRSIRRVRFLFDALDSGDYTFHFPEESVHGSERLLNTSLNRVKLILEHARDEQMEREKYFEFILDSVDTGILVVDDERGLVLRHNRAALALLDMEAITHIKRIKDRLPAFSVRTSHTTLRGKRVRIVAFSDIKGELANQELDSWAKLIRVLTHEIMNTVTPIISLSDTLLKNSRGEQRDGLNVINRTGKELITFVENYRKFTHVPTPRPALFYVKPFLVRMAGLAGPLLPPESRLELSVEPQDLLVYADEGLIARVVTNLLKNAAEAISPQGYISIRSYSDEHEAVVIDISNNGPLIPDDVAAHIFIPFFSTKNNGSGIGLSISRQIMRLSNGSITLVSDRGAGLTTFRLTFN